MKILVLVSRFPYPLEKGDKLRAYYQLKALSKKHEVILCALTDQSVSTEALSELEKFCHQVHLFPLKKHIIYWNTAKQLFTGKPYQVGYFFQKQIKKRINAVIRHEKPDHIYCQLIRTTEYVKEVMDIPKTLDYMDTLSKGMLRRAEKATGIKKQLFLVEGKRLSEYENRIFDYFNHHTIISEQDRDFIPHPQKNKIAIIENGISKKFSNYQNQLQKEYDLVFTGNMHYPPNVDCAVFLVNDVLPLLKNRFPEIKLLLSGANPHPKVAELDKQPEVTVTGWVDDIRESYAKGRIFAAPLQIGTGLQNKLLEAMAMGLPCVTTPLANNALNAVPDQSVLIGKNAEQIAAHITALLTDETLKTKIAENGKAFVQERFDWDKSTDRLIDLMHLK